MQQHGPIFIHKHNVKRNQIKVYKMLYKNQKHRSQKDGLGREKVICASGYKGTFSGVDILCFHW